MLGSLLKRAVHRTAAVVAAPSVRATSATTKRSLATLSRKPTTVKPLALSVAPKRLMSTAAAKHPDDAIATEEPQGGLLNRGYDYYPLVGLGLAAAITQEWWIMDEYWITGGCYAGVMYTAYLFGSDQIEKSGKDQFNKLVEQTRAAFGIRLDTLKRYQAMENFSLSYGDELRALYAQEAKVNEMSVQYRNLKLKSDTYTRVVQKLNSIKVLEDDARTQAIAALSKKAGEYVTTAYASAPASVKQKNIESGIAAIAPELSTRSIAMSRAKPPAPLAADDPVKLLFDEFLATPRSLAQLGVEDYAAKFMDKDSKAH